MRNLLFLVIFLFFNKTTQAQTSLRRVAFVVGNAVYEESNTLYNPVNDARDLAKSLTDLGFEVYKFENVKQQEFQKIINRYGTLLKKDPLSTVGVFYYSGHGMQIKGRNFLMPTDAKDIEDEEDVENRCINLDLLMTNLYDAGNLMNIVILDACRDNPFDYGIEVVSKDADSKKREGLAAMDAPVGTFIAFATSPNNTANDGDGLNGLYTQELIKAIQIPDLTIEQVFKKVRTQVKEISDGEQIPWENSSLEYEFYFSRSTQILSKGMVFTSTNENLPLPERYARDMCGCLNGFVRLTEKIDKMPTNIASEKLARLKEEEETTVEQSEKCLKNITKEYIEQITTEDEQKAMVILQKICPKVHRFLLAKK
jgi:Caspase domain